MAGLTAGYGAAEVLHGIDLAVAEGGATAVLGANGAGKTTLLRAITGAVRRGGRVTFAGTDVTSRRTDQIARLGIGHVPQGRGTLRTLSVRDNLLAGALLRRDRGAVRTDLDECLELFPRLGQRLDASGGNLSGGEQQMLAIARALMARPRLLLLDEPSLGLAPRVTAEVFAALAGLRRERGLTLLLVEQNARLALDLVDDAAVVEAGRLTLTGPAAEVAGDDAVRRAYLGV
ncbi:MAG TPA: ABC transporter ATP-binding protein [Mycobacteriales bacterium]|nr:ABC transporter ATP-binding protein [Mycobacteriales bacterium]